VAAAGFLGGPADIIAAAAAVHRAPLGMTLSLGPSGLAGTVGSAKRQGVPLSRYRERGKRGESAGQFPPTAARGVRAAGARTEARRPLATRAKRAEAGPGHLSGAGLSRHVPPCQYVTIVPGTQTEPADGVDTGTVDVPAVTFAVDDAFTRRSRLPLASVNPLLDPT